MRSILSITVALAFGLLIGCQAGSEVSKTEEQESTSTVAVTENMPIAIDMCAEHSVLEAVCTKCNPALIPIFQTKGDWCSEHGFPESFCPICKPEQGGRPQANVEDDGAPADGMLVKLKSKQVAEQIGIETATAVTADKGSTVIATAMIVADNSQSAAVNVRVPGVVREFRVQIGSWVDKGDPLAVIESASLAEERSRLQSARAREAVTEAAYARAKDLRDRGISASREVQVAEKELEEAKADVSAAQAAIEMAGASEGIGGRYVLEAPIAGVVTQRNFSVGALVDEEHPFIEIINTSVLWADIDVPESQGSLIAVGQRVLIEVDGLPNREFNGTIQYVAPVVDPRTRTIRARAALDNRDGALRANVFARAHIFTNSGSGVLVPRDAIQEAKGVHLVFIPVAQDEYRARRVQTMPSDGRLIAVTDGLEVGEDVVTTGSFLLKTETLKGSIGAGCCEIEKPK